MENIITNSLFLSVEQAVARACRRAQQDPKLVITEGDLQSHIFAELIGDQGVRESGAYVHNQINYLKEDGRLGLVPDIVLLDPDSYSVDENGALHDRKGYSVWGSSIAIELKLLRSNRSNGFVDGVLDDIAKLKRIRAQHYTNDTIHRYFAASVVLCRQDLSREGVEQLREAAADSEISLWLFSVERG